MACRGCSSSDGCGCSVVGSADSVITMAGTGTPISSPYTPTFNGDTWMEGLTETTQSALSGPRVPVVDSVGNAYTVPLPSDVVQGLFGGNAFSFTFNATTTAPPADGGIRFNNATYGSVTAIYVDYQETNGSDVSDWLASLDNSAGSPKGRLRLYSQLDPTDWVDFTLTAVVDSTGYYTLTVTYNADSGTTLSSNAGDLVLDFTPTSDGSVGGFNSIQTIETVTTTYQFDIADVGKYMRSTSASGFNMTVPANATVAFTIGSRIEGIQAAAGQITFVAAGGVTINATPGLKTTGQWASWALIKVATDEWDLTGNLSS